MKNKLLHSILLFFLGFNFGIQAQSIPGDEIVYGPMMSPPYNNKVRIWVMTKNNTGSGNTLSISMSENSTPGTLLAGTLFNTDTRLGYNLRSYEYTNLLPGGTYTAKIMVNGVPAANRTATIKNEQEIVDDFEFLSGGCARIYDLSRCIDTPESTFHTNGTPEIFNVMGQEGSKMMVWLGDATYLLGLQHAAGQCPGALDDWANKDMAFDRYKFYRGFHHNLIKSMPQLAITDNHDTGPNDFDKTMPTLGQMKEIFKDWWPNPEYLSTPEGSGLHSSYKYKDVEYFLLDNRSYRNGNSVQLGPDQMIWLKNALSASTARFKVIISGTPTFTNLGGRNFSATAEATDLTNHIKNNNINGVLCLSADIHSQRVYTRQGSDVNYPLYDFVSGNVNSDVSPNAPTIDYNANPILFGGNQTYLRINVFGPEDDRRMKVEYVRENGVAYFESIIHEDMLTSQNADALKLELNVSNSLSDTSTYNHVATTANVTYVNGRNDVANEALNFTANTTVTIPNAASLNFHNRPFSLVCWVKPTQFQTGGSTILSNGTAGAGVSFGIDANGKITYKDHASNITYSSPNSIQLNRWTYITWKYDNVRRKLYIYSNGSLIQTCLNVTSPIISTADLKVGDDFEGKKFIGALDNLTLYGRLISDATILDGAQVVNTHGSTLRVAGASQMAIPNALTNNLLSNDFTIQFWARLNADPGTNYKILSSNGRVNNYTTGISFEYPASNKLDVVLGNNTTAGWSKIAEQGAVWNIGEWNHVTVTAVKNGLLKYYVNGVFVAQMNFGQYIVNPWTLGLGTGTAGAASPGPVAADLDDLRIWQRALTPAEILQHMHYELTGTETGLGIYYNFEHTVGDTNTITSKGTFTQSISLNGGSLVDSTSPVANIPATYQSVVKGKWTKNNIVNVAGLNVLGTITDYTSNVVIGKNSDATTDFATGSTTLSYLKGGWRLDPNNLDTSNFQINTSHVFADSGQMDATIDHYELVKGDPTGTYQVVATGVSVAGMVDFNNVPVEQDNYYLGYVLTSVLDNETFNSINNMLSLYPNPTDGKVTIQVKDEIGNSVYVEVFDIVGRKVLEVQKQPIGGNQKIDLDLSGIAGEQLFVIRVHIDDKTETFKLFKKS